MLITELDDRMSENESPVVTKKMLALGFTAPFIFSIGGMVIAYFATSNASSKIRSISLIIATFLGLLIAIGVIFLMQWYINRKIAKK
jgi:hypothetical protein